MTTPCDGLCKNRTKDHQLFCDGRCHDTSHNHTPPADTGKAKCLKCGKPVRSGNTEDVCTCPERKNGGWADTEKEWSELTEARDILEARIAVFTLDPKHPKRDKHSNIMLALTEYEILLRQAALEEAAGAVAAIMFKTTHSEGEEGYNTACDSAVRAIRSLTQTKNK